MISQKPHARFCNTTCRDSFREDRRQGLIYPAIHTPEGKYSAEQWSLVNCSCAYCGASVQGRALKLPPNWS